MARIAGSWLQVVGGDLTSYTGINIDIPASCVGSETCLPYIDIAASGVAYPRFDENGLVISRGEIDYGGAEGAAVGDPNNWRVTDPSLWREQLKGAQYYASLLSFNLAEEDIIEGNASLSAIDGLNDGVVAEGEAEIKVVRGSLTIDQNLDAAQGSLILVLVTGSITINSNVNQVEGVFVADGGITIQGSSEADPQIVLEGTYIADADASGSEGLVNNRDRGVENNFNPPAVFRYRPDLVVTLLRAGIGLGRTTDWQELAP